MSTIRTSGELLTNIATDLADNNAGLISAADVRNNMSDTVASINAIVASGDTNSRFPFWNDVRFKKTGSVGGTIIVESGILFPNGPNNPATRQVEPFLGVGNLQHNQLGGLTVGDPHTQYLPISGSRPMTGNLQMGNNWIGSSGVSGRGFRFVDHPTSGTQILSSGTFVFGDNSIIRSGRGVAKAWINFDGSGVSSIPVVRSAYNITQLIDAGTGKYRVTFASGVLGSNNYVAVGSSNARGTANAFEDFDRHTVGMVARSGVDPSRQLSFVILNELGQYVDGEINNLVVFDDGPGVSSDSVSVS
jgi:hypothetical protein